RRVRPHREGDGPDQRGGGGAGPGLDGTVAGGATADAIEEVARVVRSVGLAGAAPRLDERPGTGAPAALEPPVDRRAGGKRVGRDLLGYDLVSVPAPVPRALGAAELALGAFHRNR